MSMKTLLVYLPSEKNAEAIMSVAAKIAAPRKAHIIGFHIIPDLPVYGEFPAEVSADVLESLMKAGRDTAVGAKRVFEAAVAPLDSVTSDWRQYTASYVQGADLIAEQGRSADLILCGKASDDVPDNWSDAAEIAIMRSGRPVLVLPTSPVQKQLGTHAVVAWNDTREAARAIFDSLDLLRDASTVRVVTFISNENERAAAQSSGSSVIANLSRHGIPASLDISYASGAGAGDAILSSLIDEGCDLLVMGAYSHSRFREMIFGGASRDVLRESWVPTLLSH